MRTLRRWPFYVAAMTALLLTVLTGTRTASAHAYVIHTDPTDGAMLATAPRQLQVWFNEPILLDLSTFQLDDSQGHHYAVTPVHADGADTSLVSIGGRPAGPMAAAVVLDVPTLAQGAYHLTWSAVSADDLHATVGDLVFGIGTTALPQHRRAVSAVPSFGEVWSRWLVFGGLAGLLGSFLLALLGGMKSDESPLGLPPGTAGIPFGNSPPSLIARRFRKRVYTLAIWSGGIALVASVGMLAVQSGGGGTGAGTLSSRMQFVLTSTAYGVRWEISFAVLVALTAFSWWMRANATRRRTMPANSLLVVPIALAVPVLVLHALQSHVASVDNSSWLDIPAATLHLLAAGVWSGGLLALAVGCLPLMRQGPDGIQLAWAVLRRFGAVALASVVVLAITGLYASGRLIATPDALLLSPYGRTLLLKTGVLLAVGALGLANAAVLHSSAAALLARLLRRPAGGRPFSTSRLQRTVALEAGGVALIVLLAAALASTQPARGPAYDPPVANVDAVSQNLSGNAADLVVVFDVKPDRPGQNFLTLGVYNTRRPAPAPITAVDVRLLPPNGAAAYEQPATALGGNQFQVSGNMITVSGAWTLVVTVHRAGLSDVTTSIPWTVLPPIQPGSDTKTIISRSPLAPVVDLAALAILLLGLVLAIAYMLRRRTSRDRLPPSTADLAERQPPPVAEPSSLQVAGVATLPRKE